MRGVPRPSRLTDQPPNRSNIIRSPTNQRKTKPMTQIVDALLLAAFAVFCFVMALLFIDLQQSTEAIVLSFLSVASFGAAGYRASL